MGSHGTKRDKMGPNWDQMGQTLGKNWDQRETKVGPKLDQSGTKVGPNWDKYGTYMGPKWDQIRPNWDNVDQISTKGIQLDKIGPNLTKRG